MKKILFMAMLLIATQFAKAQTEKGKQTLGLNLQFQHSSATDNYIDPVSNAFSVQDLKNTSFYIGPSYSYFISNNLDLGATLQYTHYRLTNNNINGEQKQINNGFGSTVFLRKYFMYQNKIGLRAGPYFGYNYSKAKYLNPGSNAVYNYESKVTSYSGGLNAELLYYPTRQLGVSLSLASINYSHSKTDNGNQGKGSGDTFSASFINSGVGVSVFYTLGK